MRPHKIPYGVHGLATLLVDYLSRWGEEVELLSVLLATLIIGLLFDARGYLDNPWTGALFGVIVAVEFLLVIYVAYKRRQLEEALWRAVHEAESSVNSSSDNSTGH